MAAKKVAGEVPWIDAWVRWERNSKECCDDGDGGKDDDDDDCPPAVPTATYSFRYPRPSSSSSRGDISIELGGFDTESEQAWSSTGLTLWRSSHYLCEYLLDHSELLRGKRILELGSGLGRCGILAYHLSRFGESGGSEADSAIFLTDGDTDTLVQLRANVANNTPAGCGDGNGKGGEDGDSDGSKRKRISCRQLLWGEETAQEFLSRHASDERFDVILGSDLVYVPSVIEPLFETVRTLLARDDPGGIFLMAHCSRREGNKVDVGMVTDAADRAGFTHDIVVEADDISLFAFRRAR